LATGCVVKQVAVFKRRWRRKGTNTTCHSRPPDDPVLVRFCTLIVLLKIWAWLSGPRGIHHCEDTLSEREQCVCSPRTLQRWFSRATARAMDIQQAIRLALIERCEPRPLERLFPGGLSPPEGLRRRRWKDYPSVVHLWRALALALQGAEALGVPMCTLLAEARGRLGATADCLIV